MAANTIVGGVVYAASEITVQSQTNKDRPGRWVDKIDFKRVLHLGTLGGIENGMFMTAWYSELTIFF